jgi:hypothetical protein
MYVSRVVLSCTPIVDTDAPVHQGIAGVKAEDAFAPDFHMDEPIPEAGNDRVNGDAPAPAAGAYTRFSAPGEIAYTPEAALHEGLQMVGALRAGIRTLELGNKMRKDVWMRELERCVAEGDARAVETDVVTSQLAAGGRADHDGRGLRCDGRGQISECIASHRAVVDSLLTVIIIVNTKCDP